MPHFRKTVQNGLEFAEVVNVKKRKKFQIPLAE